MKTPDLLDVLFAEYQAWVKTGKVKIQDREFQLKLDLPPAGTMEPEPEHPVEQFFRFVRSYVKLNPIVATSTSLGAFGVFLADQRHLTFIREAVLEMGGPNVSIPVTGAGFGLDRLPPAHEVPITGVVR